MHASLHILLVLYSSRPIENMPAPSAPRVKGGKMSGFRGLGIFSPVVSSVVTWDALG